MRYKKARSRKDWPEDIYNEEFRDELLDDDEISAEEAGFMRGYMEEEDS